MNKKQQDIEMFGSNNEIGYVIGNIVLFIIFVLLASITIILIK